MIPNMENNIKVGAKYMLSLSEAIVQLDRLMKSGDLVREGNELLGLASDGTVVVIEPDMSDPKAAARITRYIAANPNPTDW